MEFHFFLLAVFEGTTWRFSAIPFSHDLNIRMLNRGWLGADISPQRLRSEYHCFLTLSDGVAMQDLIHLGSCGPQVVGCSYLFHNLLSGPYPLWPRCPYVPHVQLYYSRYPIASSTNWVTNYQHV